MHEALFDDRFLEGTGVTTLDFAKALIDEGFHPMTMYFPLVVHGALLMEPTENESKAPRPLHRRAARLAEEAEGGRATLPRRAAFRAAPPPRRDRRARASPCCAGNRRNLHPKRRNKKKPQLSFCRGQGLSLSLGGQKNSVAGLHRHSGGGLGLGIAAGRVELRLRQTFGARQIGALERGDGQVGARHVGAGEIGARQICARKSVPRKLAPLKSAKLMHISTARARSKSAPSRFPCLTH